MIRAAKNGCSSEITFKRKKVYHDWESSSISKSDLGEKLDKIEFLKTMVHDGTSIVSVQYSSGTQTKLEAVEKLMIDWELYENGWYVEYPNVGYKNKHLFYYLQQLSGYGRIRPEELKYFG
jgi:hypothetical protein